MQQAFSARCESCRYRPTAEGDLTLAGRFNCGTLLGGEIQTTAHAQRCLNGMHPFSENRAEPRALDRLVGLLQELPIFENHGPPGTVVEPQDLIAAVGQVELPTVASPARRTKACNRITQRVRHCRHPARRNHRR